MQLSNQDSGFIICLYYKIPEKKVNFKVLNR